MPAPKPSVKRVVATRNGLRLISTAAFAFVAFVAVLSLWTPFGPETARGEDAGGPSEARDAHTEISVAAAMPNGEPCAIGESEEAPQSYVRVDTSRRLLYLCRDGVVDAQYRVNLGSGGVGKKKQGDKKTPVGRYALSKPRASSSGFTWFVPIGYPTSSQRKAGYTGGSVGIHGPPDWMPQPVIDFAFDTPWTDGCIMVRTKNEIEAIRAWLLEHRPDQIEIDPEGT